MLRVGPKTLTCASQELYLWATLLALWIVLNLVSQSNKTYFTTRLYNISKRGTISLSDNTVSCVCVCIHLYVHAHTHTHRDTDTYTYVYMHIFFSLWAVSSMLHVHSLLCVYSLSVWFFPLTERLLCSFKGLVRGYKMGGKFHIMWPSLCAGSHKTPVKVNLQVKVSHNYKRSGELSSLWESQGTAVPCL